MPTRLSGRVCGGFGGEAGGLVKAARDWFRLQVARALMAHGALSCRRPRAWFRQGAFAASRASAVTHQYRCIIS